MKVPPDQGFNRTSGRTAGDILKDQMVHHAYVNENGRVERMDIRNS